MSELRVVQPSAGARMGFGRIVAALTLGACASSAPASEPVPTPAPMPPVSRPAPPPATPGVAPLPGRITFAYARGSRVYEIISDASIVAAAEIGGQPLMLNERATVSLALQPDDQRVIVAGSIQNLAQNPAGTTPALSLPSAFVDTVWVGIAPPPGPDPLCGAAPIPPSHLTAFLPAVSGELEQGRRWQRTYIYSICQGPIPVRIERTDSYVVQGAGPEAGPGGIAIARSSNLRLAGRGVDGQHNVTVEGTGSARAVFHMDARAGHLLDATEESTSDIGITASGRTRRFTQNLTRRIHRVP